jgi:hypothetical protein
VWSWCAPSLVDLQTSPVLWLYVRISLSPKSVQSRLIPARWSISYTRQPCWDYSRHGLVLSYPTTVPRPMGEMQSRCVATKLWRNCVLTTRRNSFPDIETHKNTVSVCLYLRLGFYTDYSRSSRLSSQSKCVYDDEKPTGNEPYHLTTNAASDPNELCLLVRYRRLGRRLALRCIQLRQGAWLSSVYGSKIRQMWILKIE